MPADIRSSQLRQAREGVDTGRGVLRTAGNPTREAAIGRGSFVNWYKDLGISTTEPGAQQIRKEEADFQAKVAEKRARVEAARGQLQGAWGELAGQESQLNEASGNLSSVGSAVEDSWNTFKSTFIPIRVIEGEKVWSGDSASEGGRWDTNESVGGVYYFPKEVAESLMGKKGIVGEWVDGGFNVYARNYGNKPLHEAFSTQANILESSYKEKAARELSGQIESASSALSGQYAQLGEAKNTLSGYQAQVDAAQAGLDAAVAKRQKEWDELHNKYNNKIKTMNDIFSGLTIGKGTDNEST